MEVFQGSYFSVVKWMRSILWFMYIEENLSRKHELSRNSPMNPLCLNRAL